jgi:hypothetical protein
MIVTHLAQKGQATCSAAACPNFLAHLCLVSFLILDIGVTPAVGSGARFEGTETFTR